MAENRYCDIEAFLDTIPQYAGESGVVRAGALLESLQASASARISR